MEDIFGAYEFALKHQWNAFLVFDRDSCSLIYSSENVPHLLPALEGETATTLADLKSTWPESENPAFWQAIANPDPASLPQTLYPGDRTGVDAGIPVLVLPLPGPHHRSIVGFPAVAPLPQTGNWNKGTLDAKGVFDYDGTPLYLDPSWRQEIFSIARNGDNGGEFDWVCREDLAIFRSNWEVVCWGDGSPRIWKSRLHNSSYGHFWAEIKAHADEGAKKVFLTLRNINAAEEHFQALRRIEGKHRAMLDAMPDLFLYLDSSGHFIDIQLPTNGDDFPFNGEILGKTIRDVFPPGVAEKFMQGLREVTQNTAISVFNFSLGEAEKIRYFEARITLSTTLDFLIVLRETTHRVQSQRILNLTKYSVDHAADLILWMNGDGNIIYANETALRTLGFSAKDLYTRQYFDLDPDFDPADWKKTWEGLQNGPARKFLTLFRSADNHAFEVEVSLNHISLEGQEMLCAFASAVGERRTLSAEVRKMKLALQSVSNSVMLLDREDRVQWVNRAYELLWGTPLDQIVGLDSLQFVDKFLKTNREIKNPRDPIPYSGEVVRKDKSGNPRIIQFARDPIYDEDKKLTGFVISEQDITEKRRQEEFARQRELRQSELAQLGQFALRDTNILSIFEESARIIERVFNMDACCLYRWDEQRKALKRGGHSGKLEIPWEKHIDNLPADWAEGVFETMLHMTILPAGKLVIPAVSGALGASPVVMGLEILLGTPEQPFGLLGMYYKGDAAFTPDDLAFLDTLRTFLHQSVERLNAMENLRLFSDAVQTSMEGIHITDLNGRIFFANQMADIILGYNIGGQLGRNIRELVTDSTDRDAIYNTLSKNGAWKGEVDVLSRSGKIIPVFLSAVLILNNMRKIIGMLVVFRDIGEEKARKKELIEAKEAAESAARTKSEFLATMSHEIRTPMNGVIGMTNLLLETELSAEQQEYLETLRSSGESLLTIINDILDFSKIEAGKIELEKHPFQLSSCVEEVVDLLATKADEKQLDLMYYLDPALPGEVVGDVTRVRQILVNLVGNAIKFTPNGEIRIYVDKTGSAKAPRMRFRVEDTGIGIPEDKRDRLFKSFSQVDASTRRKYGGTGMGLAISKRLTTLMGGEMEVESGEGKGSIFSFSLPLIAGQALDSQKDVAGKENFVDGKSLLLVVSSKHHRKILSRVLGAAGAKVTPVASGPDAFARLGKGNFDGIILDYDVATGDPFAFIRELRGGPAGSTLPLLMFSSLRNSNHTLLEFPGTVQRILPKPFRHGQFLRAVGELFHQGRGADPTRAKLVKHIDETMARKYPLSILLAEDNMVNQKLAVRMLAKMGYRSDVAANGLEALNAVKSRHYDLILMDMQMPEMDGLEATQAIRRLKGSEGPVIVALTANAMSGDRDLCLASGMDDYLSKPVSISALQDTLRKWAKSND